MSTFICRRLGQPEMLEERLGGDAERLASRIARSVERGGIPEELEDLESGGARQCLQSGEELHDRRQQSVVSQNSSSDSLDLSEACVNPRARVHMNAVVIASL